MILRSRTNSTTISNRTSLYCALGDMGQRRSLPEPDKVAPPASPTALHRAGIDMRALPQGPGTLYPRWEQVCDGHITLFESSLAPATMRKGQGLWSGPPHLITWSQYGPGNFMLSELGTSLAPFRRNRKATPYLLLRTHQSRAWFGCSVPKSRLISPSFQLKLQVPSHMMVGSLGDPAGQGHAFDKAVCASKIMFPSGPSYRCKLRVCGSPRAFQGKEQTNWDILDECTQLGAEPTIRVPRKSSRPPPLTPPGFR